MTAKRRCGATIEVGPKRRSGVVYARKTCRAWPLKGKRYCRWHAYLEG